MPRDRRPDGVPGLGPRRAILGRDLHGRRRHQLTGWGLGCSPGSSAVISSRQVAANTQALRTACRSHRRGPQDRTAALDGARPHRQRWRRCSPRLCHDRPEDTRMILRRGHRGATSVMDTIGCAYGGYARRDRARSRIKLAGRRHGKAAGDGMIDQRRQDQRRARRGSANGVMIRYLDFNDAFVSLTDKKKKKKKKKKNYRHWGRCGAI